MSKDFVLTTDELFGSYCYIEQKRYGVHNEKFLYKIIGKFTSNAWSNVPVDANDKEPHIFNHSEEVINVVCCGVCEDKIERYKLSDVEIISNKDQQLADLEAKLAEAQKTIEIQKMSNNALQEENLDYRYDITDTAYEQAKYMAESWEEDYQQEITELKQQLAEKEQENERLKEEICKYEITLMDKNSQLKNQLHDLPNKIVEEISKELKSLYKNYPIIYSEDKDIVKSCYDKDSVNKILDTILEKYGVENE